MKPYTESHVSENIVIRTFHPDMPEDELKWHWDEETRIVTPLNMNDWQFQFDNELPIPLDKEINIPAGVIHRVIRGNTKLIVKIEKSKGEIHKTF
jgi:hypothetical protein